MVEIVESTPRRLVLLKSGRTMRLFLVGGVGLGLLCCMMTYWGARTASVRCMRGPAGLTCDVTEKLLGIIPLDRKRIEHVTRAVVGYTNASDPSYHVELETEGFHDEQLSSITASERQCRSSAESLNDFLRSGQDDDYFVQFPDWIWFVMLPPFLGAALGCFMLAQPYRLEIDRDQGFLTIRDGFKKEVSHPLADVDDVRLEERKHSNETIREVFLLLKDGKRQRLDIGFDQVDLVSDYLQRRDAWRES